MKKNLLTKIRNRKGFTLAELLIVVAIIGVLVAISIPIFTSQLEKAREATDLANVRAAYAEVTAAYLEDDTSHVESVAVTQKQSGWQGTNKGSVAGKTFSAKTTGSYTVSVDASGNVTIQ
jgi:prepilin-type N-terminal cleavage/methylation domain-containing protein